MVQDEFATGMYVVDQSFRIVNLNSAMGKLYPEVKIGDTCYSAIALRPQQCDVCPLKTDNALFYNPIRREWIYANAAKMDYPCHGECYTVQFQIRKMVSEQGKENLENENMDEHITDLSGGRLDVCVLGGYCEPGTPLCYANEHMVRLLGYEDIHELNKDIGGMTSNAVHPDDLPRVTEELTKCARNGGYFESAFRMHRKDHTWFWIVAHGKRVETKSGAFMLLCVVTDMTEYMKRQSELRDENVSLLKKELTSQEVLAHMPGGYHRCANAEGWPFLYFGSSFEEITGWTRDEIEHDMGNLFINMVLPEDIPLCAGIVEEIQRTGYSNALYRLKKKGGGYTWVSDSTVRVDLGDECFYHGVLADVTSQVEEMEKAKLDAEASSLAKSTFLFNASHDIRTPMNAIQGFAHIIERNADDPALVLDTVRKLRQSGDVLLTLMNDVLELSRIERGKDVLDIRPLDMTVHTAKLNEMMSQEMERSGIDFHMENDIRHAYVFADDLKLTRIAMNLLSNARKFTPAGGSVTFGVKETDCDGQRATYSLYVRDTGIGMSKEFQERAFEQFERERSSTVSGVSGSGLGLAIIKKITDLVGGKCWIDSELGKGTTVTCAVPLDLAKPEDFRGDALPRDVDFSGKRILLVEDNDFNREIARYVFQGVGFEVEEAENGVVCLEKLTAAPAGYFDLVLMDVQMPLMDGYTATKEIRRYSDPAIANIPIVAMTANAFEEDRQKCLDVGMNGHIGKPLEAHNVHQELVRVLSK